MKKLFILTTLLVLSACSSTPQRSEATTDSGRPLSDNMKSYIVEHYGLRTEVHPETKSISGSVAIQLSATESLFVLELDFDGVLTIDRVEDSSGVLEYTRDEATIMALTGCFTMNLLMSGLAI